MVCAAPALHRSRNARRSMNLYRRAPPKASSEEGTLGANQQNPRKGTREGTMKRTWNMILVVMLGSATLLAWPAHHVAAQADLGAKIAAAKTSADHEAIAAEFEQEAKDLEAKSALHADMARHYNMEQYTHQRKPRLKKHCEDLSASLKKAAEQAREMAKLHHELAQKAGK